MQFRDRDAGHRRVAGQRHHRVAVSAEDEGVDVFHGDVEFHRDEGAEAGRIEDARHADHAVLGEAADVIGDMAHRVQGVADDDQRGVGGILHHLLGHVGHDLLVGGQKVVAAHPGFARDAGGDDDDVRILGLLIAVRADEVGVVLLDRRRLRQVEGLALGHAFDDIHQHHIAQGLFTQTLRRGRTDISRTDDGHFLIHTLLLFFDWFFQCFSVAN